MCCCDFVPKTNPVFSFHSVLSDDYELSRNISSSMENLLFIASPDSAFERTISVTASLPGYGLSSAPPHDKTANLPSPGHCSVTSAQSSTSAS